jgi:hypothetical protein
MNVEDSYEGAVRRLQRLERAGLAPQNDEGAQRMRELEELASLACEDNERLKSELETARREIQVLRACVAELQEPTANEAQVFAPRPQPPQPQPPQPQPQPPFVPFAAPPSFPEALSDEGYGLAARSGNKALVYLFVLAAAGAIVAALGVTRPWASTYTPPPAPIEWHVPPPPPPPAQPVETAPPLAPAVQPAAPKVETDAPKAEPRKRARHAAEDEDPAAATSDEAAPEKSDDPIAGSKL